MKFQWQLTPFVPIFLFYSIGLMCGYAGVDFNKFSFCIAVVSGIAAFINMRIKSGLVFIKTCLLYLSVLLFSYFYISIEKSSIPLISLDDQDKQYLIVRIIENPVKKKTWSAKAEIIQETNGKPFDNSEQFIQLFLRSQAEDSIYKHDILRIKIKLDTLDLNESNGYHAYLKSKNISAFGFVASHEWELVHRDKCSSLIKMARKIKSSSFEIITRHLKKREQVNIIKAMIFADKSDLSSDITEEFRRSGTLHILAVSGLHVGIVYLLIFSLLKSTPVPFTIRKYLIPFFTIIFLWCYVIFIGSPSSASRAACMFTVFSLARLFQRDYHSINILALTAIIQCIMNPFVLFQVGFQYSYAAMLGIFLILPKIQKQLPKKEGFYKSILLLFCLSLSAQITITPLSLYYFGTVSILSSLSSIIVVPLASISIISSILVILIDPLIPFISELISEVSSAGLSIIQKTNAMCSSFHFAEQSIQLNRIQLILSYLSIAVVFYYSRIMHFRKFKWSGRFFKMKKTNRIGASILLISFILLNFMIQEDRKYILIPSFQEPQSENIPVSFNDKSENIPFAQNQKIRNKGFKKTGTMANVDTIENKLDAKKIELKKLDPNHCSKEELISRGINVYAASNLIKYREKGGKLNSLQNILKIYGMDSYSIEKLTKIFNFSIQKDATKSTIELIEINNSDEEGLRTLKGIGPTYARRILKFREALGGFYHVDQIAETYGLPDSTFISIKKYLICNGKVDLIKINSVNINDLVKHPYFNFKEAKTLVRYRESNGNFKSLSDISKIISFNEDFLKKISAYLDYEVSVEKKEAI